MIQPQDTKKIVQFIDTYCELYQDLFTEVRAFEYFKYLHIGIMSDIKRKTLPEIARVVGLENSLYIIFGPPYHVERKNGRKED
ncbi:MAG TPA: hypothetical protein V6C58_26505 [Allocoleopsis sp.]